MFSAIFQMSFYFWYQYSKSIKVYDENRNNSTERRTTHRHGQCVASPQIRAHWSHSPFTSSLPGTVPRAHPGSRCRSQRPHEIEGREWSWMDEVLPVQTRALNPTLENSCLLKSVISNFLYKKRKEQWWVCWGTALITQLPETYVSSFFKIKLSCKPHHWEPPCVTAWSSRGTRGKDNC